MTSADDERLARRVAIYHQVCQKADNVQVDIQIHDDHRRGDELGFLAQVVQRASEAEPPELETVLRELVGYGVAWLEAIEAGRTR